MKKTIAETISATTDVLVAAGVPSAVARVKAESTSVGFFLLIPGLTLCLGAGGALILGLLLRVGVAWPFTVGVGVLAATGVLLVALGFSLVSREAAPLIGQFGEWVVNIVMRWRGKP